MPWRGPWGLCLAMCMIGLATVSSISTGCRTSTDETAGARQPVIAPAPAAAADEMAAAGGAEADTGPATPSASGPAQHGPCCPENGAPPGWLEPPPLYDKVEITSHEESDDGLIVIGRASTTFGYAEEGVLRATEGIIEGLKDDQEDLYRAEFESVQIVDGVEQQSLGTVIWTKARDVPGAHRWDDTRQPAGYWFRPPANE